MPLSSSPSPKLQTLDRLVRRARFITLLLDAGLLSVWCNLYGHASTMVLLRMCTEDACITLIKKAHMEI